MLTFVIDVNFGDFHACSFSTRLTTASDIS